MKQNEIVVGETYRTRIGEALSCVVVTRVIVSEERVWSSFTPEYRKKTRFEVRRVEESKPLPKHRSASALHEIRHAQPIFGGVEPECNPYDD